MNIPAAVWLTEDEDETGLDEMAEAHEYWIRELIRIYGTATVQAAIQQIYDEEIES